MIDVLKTMQVDTICHSLTAKVFSSIANIKVTKIITSNLQYYGKRLYILREINLAISDKAGCISELLTEREII